MPASTKIRPLPPEVRERLAKLLPLLASPHDGERIGALAAIGRVLEADGLDWFDFTGAFTGAAQTTTPPPPPPPPPPRQGNGITMSRDQTIEVVSALRANRRFSAQSEKFLDSLLSRAAMYSDVFFSPKQCQWLLDLCRQAGMM